MRPAVPRLGQRPGPAVPPAGTGGSHQGSASWPAAQTDGLAGTGGSHHWSAGMTVEVCWTVCGLRLVPSLAGRTKRYSCPVPRVPMATIRSCSNAKIQQLLWPGSYPRTRERKELRSAYGRLSPKSLKEVPASGRWGAKKKLMGKQKRFWITATRSRLTWLKTDSINVCTFLHKWHANCWIKSSAKITGSKDVLRRRKKRVRGSKSPKRRNCVHVAQSHFHELSC